MTYELTLNITENSDIDRNIESMAGVEQISREEAALRLLAKLPRSKATPEALAIMGAFSSPEDSALMDEVMELVMSERMRRNAEPPRV